MVKPLTVGLDDTHDWKNWSVLKCLNKGCQYLNSLCVLSTCNGQSTYHFGIVFHVIVRIDKENILWLQVSMGQFISMENYKTKMSVGVKIPSFVPKFQFTYIKLSTIWWYRAHHSLIISIRLFKFHDTMFNSIYRNRTSHFHVAFSKNIKLYIVSIYI
jgi:hypothetical protein